MTLNSVKTPTSDQLREVAAADGAGECGLRRLTSLDQMLTLSQQIGGPLIYPGFEIEHDIAPTNHTRVF